MSQKNVDLVKGLYDSFARGDVGSVLATMDPGIQWNEAEHFPYADRNPYVGPTAVAEGLFARLVGEWEYWRLAIEEFLDAGDAVVAMGRYHALNKKTGKKIDAQFVHVWWLKNGKAVRFQQFADTYQVRSAVQPQ